MRLSLKPTYQTSATWTIPATVTKSIGLPAIALAPMVFAIPRQFHRDMTTPAHSDS